MKIGQQLILVCLYCLFAQLGIAKEHTFIFNIHSSSNQIFACNAGIKHIKPTNEVCYLAGTNTPCVSGAHDCECVGVGSGSYLKDYLKYTKEKILPNGNVIQPETGTITVDINGLDIWSTLPQDMGSESHNPNQFFTHLKSLSFNFSSERYGAEMFLDVCFKGPQIGFFQDNVKTSQLLQTTLIATDLNLNNDPAFIGYQQLSGLAVSSVVLCDLQGAGNYQLAADDFNFGGGKYDTFNSEIDFQTLNNNDFSLSFPMTSTVTGNAMNIFNQLITDDSVQSPRFCVVRYFFHETAVNNLRKWQKQQAQVKVFTTIEAP